MKLQQNLFFSNGISRWKLLRGPSSFHSQLQSQHGFLDQVNLLSFLGVSELAQRILAPNILCPSTLLTCNNFAHFTFLGESVSTPECCFIYHYSFSPRTSTVKKNMHSINTWMDERMNGKTLSKSGITGFQRTVLFSVIFILVLSLLFPGLRKGQPLKKKISKYQKWTQKRSSRNSVFTLFQLHSVQISSVCKS